MFVWGDALGFPLDAEQSGSPGVLSFTRSLMWHGPWWLVSFCHGDRRLCPLLRTRAPGSDRSGFLRLPLPNQPFGQRSASPQGAQRGHLAHGFTASLVIHEGCGLPRFIRVRPMLLAFTVFHIMCSLTRHKPVMMMMMMIVIIY